MTSVFVAGSRKLGRLNGQVRDRLVSIMAGSCQVLVGDASGADKAVQQFFRERDYSNVVVYCSGSKCRNNIGKWPTFNVEVPSNVKGRDFYTRKDIEMAQSADYGLMIWDGKSLGTIRNVLELVKREKKALVYLAPLGKFVSIGSMDEAERLLEKCQPDAVSEIGKKVGLRPKPHAAESNQHVLNL